MKKNTKNIAAVALLALAAGAFIVDRFVLGYGGPASASAAPVESTADLLAAPSKPVATASAAPAAPSVSQRIAALGIHLASLEGPPAPQATDAFVVPALWRTEAADAPKPAAQATQAGAETTALVLTAVVTNSDPSRNAATINGTVVQIGETYKGYTLLRVDRDGSPSATLRGDAGEFTLHTRVEEMIRSAQSRDGKPMFKPHHAQ